VNNLDRGPYRLSQVSRAAIRGRHLDLTYKFIIDLGGWAGVFNKTGIQA